MSNKLNVRGLGYHIHQWGEPKNPKIFAIHGWMDSGASFQYIASNLAKTFHIIAPDLRGFGNSGHDVNGYWFPDYFADLEVILNHYSANQKVNLLGHSMGGNIVLLYAGIRPNRVEKVFSLDALGIQQTTPNDSAMKYRQWLDQIEKQTPEKTYPDIQTFEQSIQRNHPRLSDDTIRFLAKSWSKQNHQGEFILRHDKKHLNTNPIRYNHDDITAIWGQIEARVGLLMAEDSPIYQQYVTSSRLEHARKLLNISDQDYHCIQSCGHMVHLEQPTKTASCINSFFKSEDS